MAEAIAAQGSGKLTIWNRAFTFLVIINVVQGMGQMMMNTLIPLYARSIGASNAMVGFVASCFAITALGIRPFSGPAFDSFSKKWLLFAALSVNCISILLYGIVTSVPALIAVRLFNGCGIACASPLALAMVSDSLPSEKLSSGISVFSAAHSIAQVVGPALGLWLAGVIGYQPVFFISSAVMLGAVTLTFILKEPGARVRKPYKISPGRIFAKEAIIPASILAIFITSFACVGSFIAIYGGLRGVGNIGLYFTVYALCLMVTQPLFGKLADRYGAAKMMVPGMAFFALSFVIISQSTSLGMFLTAAAVGACGFGVINPLIQSLCMQCVPPDARGAGGNTNFTGADVGNLIGPVVGGAVIDGIYEATGNEVAAYSSMYLFMIIPIALGLLFFLATYKKLNKLIAGNREAQKAAEIASRSAEAKRAAATDKA